jgi:exopolysaccharide/PEP-CTERM locus tyrosine autokinase
MSLIERAIDKLRREGKPVHGDRRGEPVTIGSVVAAEASAGASLPDVVRSNRIIRVDREALHNAGYLPDRSQDRRFAAEYRQIKRPLVAAMFGNESGKPRTAPSVMMASALPGDGKTFTSINLALSLACERDVSVLLVDADTPKPHVSRIFGVEEEPGLMDVLADESVDVESLVLSSDVPGLAILPAGKVHERATELLASARMRSVVERLHQRFPRRIVLFDSPPLLLSSESRALIGVCGQVVLIVKSGQTPRQAVLKALSGIDENKPVALILNRGSATAESYHGYGSYGSYGDRTA